MPTSKPHFYEFTTRKKYGVPSHNFVKKNVLCEKGDEITRFDGSLLTLTYIFRAALDKVGKEKFKTTVGFLSGIFSPNRDDF